MPLTDGWLSLPVRILPWVLGYALASCPQSVSIPAGSFVLGDNGGADDERPAVGVALNSFSIDKHEVTNASYDSCVRAGRCSPAHYGDGACMMWDGRGFRRVIVPLQIRPPGQPAVCVSWHQARSYCRWRGGDVPTEAQWEYAALAGGTSTYAWGNGPPDRSRCAQATEGKPRPAGSGPPNAWQLCDMTGNVWEWTRDRYQRDFYALAAQHEPRAPDVGQFCTIRGGGWYSGPQQLRVKNRHWFPPENGEVSIGFRCVKEGGIP